MTAASADRDDWYDRLDDPGAERRSRALWRWLPILVGLVVFELTADPILGVALGCVRFGERDLVTAWWLLHRDPGRMRAWACAGVHCAWAFVRIGMRSFGVVMLLALAIGAFGALPIVVMLQGRGAILITAASIAAFLVSAYVGIACALIGRVRVWASPTTHRARERREWPPVPPGAVNWGENRVMTVVAFAMILTPIVAMVSTAIAHQAARGGPPADLGPAVALGMILTLFAMIWLLVKISRRIAARHPAECWT